MTDNTNGDYAAFVEQNREAARAATADAVSLIGWTQAEFKVFLQAIGRFVTDQVKPLQEEIAGLKSRIAELEATGIKYVGTYQRAATYKRGDVCNHDGGMWVATCETPPQEVPGKSVCWQLSVKSYNGKDHTPRQPTGHRP
jgi:hypothetical protein